MMITHAPHGNMTFTFPNGFTASILMQSLTREAGETVEMMCLDEDGTPCCDVPGFEFVGDATYGDADAWLRFMLAVRQF